MLTMSKRSIINPVAQPESILASHQLGTVMIVLHLRQAVIDLRNGTGGETQGNAAPDHEIDGLETSKLFRGEVQLSCHFVTWTVLDFTPSPL